MTATCKTFKELQLEWADRVLDEWEKRQEQFIINQWLAYKLFRDHEPKELPNAST